LFQRSFVPTFPGDFEADVASGSLPQVSWVLAPMNFDEHPPAPPALGETITSQVVSSLVSNPALWAKTVMFLAYDENGGYFDHVAPPTAPAGTPGEYLTVHPLPPEASGIAGPIGLGFRVPCIVISPFSRGGLICSDTFDHTSMLRFLETRFGVEVPNLTAWRRSVTGDLTSALSLGAAPDTSVPTLPAPTPLSPAILAECGPTFVQGQVGQTVGGNFNVAPYPPPDTQSVPAQERGTARRVRAVVCNPAGSSGGTGGGTAGGGGGPRGSLPATGRPEAPLGTAAAVALLGWLGSRTLSRRRQLGASESPPSSPGGAR